ncbi:hypothetical protein [Streptomyces sp. NPDC002172]
MRVVTATECLTPEHSRMPGLARWARTWQQEVVLNTNTIEATAEQHNALILKKGPVDRSQRAPRSLQFFPSSELAAHRLSPSTRPILTHGRIHHGTPSRAAVGTPTARSTS